MDFFHKDPQAYQRLADQVTADKDSIAVKEEAWLEVEMKKEALEADNS